MAAVVVLVVGIGGWLTLRVPYHKWRLTSCRETAERLRAGQNTIADEFWGLLRGAPKTSVEYYTAATRHEDALIHLKYLARKEFRLTTPLTSNAAIDRFTAAAARRFPNKREWSLVFSALGDSVVVTARRQRMTDWEEFIRQHNRAIRASTKHKCKSRRDWIEAVMPVRF